MSARESVLYTNESAHPAMFLVLGEYERFLPSDEASEHTTKKNEQVAVEATGSAVSGTAKVAVQKATEDHTSLSRHGESKSSPLAAPIEFGLQSGATMTLSEDVKKQQVFCVVWSRDSWIPKASTTVTVATPFVVSDTMPDCSFAVAPAIVKTWLSSLLPPDSSPVIAQMVAGPINAIGIASATVKAARRKERIDVVIDLELRTSSTPNQKHIIKMTVQSTDANHVILLPKQPSRVETAVGTCKILSHDQGATFGNDIVRLELTSVGKSISERAKDTAGKSAIPMGTLSVSRSFVIVAKPEEVVHFTVSIAVLDKDERPLLPDYDATTCTVNIPPLPAAAPVGVKSSIAVGLIAVGDPRVGKSTVLNDMSFHILGGRAPFVVGRTRRIDATTLELGSEELTGFAIHKLDKASFPAKTQIIIDDLAKKLSGCKSLRFIDTAGRPFKADATGKKLAAADVNLLKKLRAGLPNGTPLFGDTQAEYVTADGLLSESMVHWSVNNTIDSANAMDVVVVLVDGTKLVNGNAAPDAPPPQQSWISSWLGTGSDNETDVTINWDAVRAVRLLHNELELQLASPKTSSAVFVLITHIDLLGVRNGHLVLSPNTEQDASRQLTARKEIEKKIEAVLRLNSRAKLFCVGKSCVYASMAASGGSADLLPVSNQGNSTSGPVRPLSSSSAMPPTTDDCILAEHQAEDYHPPSRSSQISYINMLHDMLSVVERRK